jgi:hypothetical protein
MSRRAKATWSLVVSAMFVCAVALAAAPDKVDFSGYEKSKPIRVFDHRKHVEQKFPCGDCHHKAMDGKIEVKCSECHKKTAEGKTPNFKDAFHKQCKGCHDRQNKEKGLKAPSKCTECHR